MPGGVRSKFLAAALLSALAVSLVTPNLAEAKKKCIYDTVLAQLAGKDVAATAFAQVAPEDQAPALPPDQLAYLAAARLQLPDPQVGIGPDPKINRWNKAFVGVEYWFWAKGDTEVPPVSESVGPVSVRLAAKVEKITVRTGEEAAMSCSGRGRPWRTGTAVETPSPTCGHRFTTTGERRLVLTATWAVSWEINGATGVIRLDRSAGRNIEVNELHAVTR